MKKYPWFNAFCILIFAIVFFNACKDNQQTTTPVTKQISIPLDVSPNDYRKNDYLYTGVNPFEYLGYFHNSMLNYFGYNYDDILVLNGSSLDTVATLTNISNIVHQRCMDSLGFSLTTVQIYNVALTTLRNYSHQIPNLDDALIINNLTALNYSQNTINLALSIKNIALDTTITPNTKKLLFKTKDTTIANSNLPVVEKNFLFIFNSITKYSLNHWTCLMVQKQQGSDFSTNYYDNIPHQIKGNSQITGINYYVGCCCGGSCACEGAYKTDNSMDGPLGPVAIGLSADAGASLVGLYVGSPGGPAGMAAGAIGAGSVSSATMLITTLLGRIASHH